MEDLSFNPHLCSTEKIAPSTGLGFEVKWSRLWPVLQILIRDLGSGLRAEKQFLGLKILEFFDLDPGSFGPWIQDGKDSDPE
jgi:hypothetical protein